MLFPSPEKLKLTRDLFRDIEAGKIDMLAAADKLSQYGEDPWICLARGNDRKAHDDWDGAEWWFWKGLDLQPGQFTFYLSLAEVRRHRDPNDALAARLYEMGMWKLADAPEIPQAVVEHFRANLGDSEFDLSAPETYQMLATVAEVRRNKNETEAREAGGENPEEPLEEYGRLLPYILLNDLQHQATSVVDYDGVVERMIENGARCAPLLWAALRDWASHPKTIQPKAVALWAAVLGEIGGVELLPGLLELVVNDDHDILLHASWAIHRLGQRFPQEVLAGFRERAPQAPSMLRCVIAEQLAMAPPEIEIRPVALSLLDGFRNFAKQQDAPYLLLTVAFALESRTEGDGAPLITRYGEMLSRKSKDWLLEEVEAEGGFVPRLLAHGVDEADLKDICMDRVLMIHEDHEDDEESAEEDLEEEDLDGDEWDEDLDEEDGPAIPTVAAPKPGRNDPCWCGSAKKYKKCHLAADEEAERTGNAVPERHKGERLETMQERAEKRAPLKSPGKPPDATEREAVPDMKTDPDTRWADQPLPALGGKTPREAVATEEGRKKVRELMHEIEEVENRSRRLGLPAMGVKELRETLGITED
jgi:hypothetical protein